MNKLICAAIIYKQKMYIGECHYCARMKAHQIIHAVDYATSIDSDKILQNDTYVDGYLDSSGRFIHTLDTNGDKYSDCFDEEDFCGGYLKSELYDLLLSQKYADEHNKKPILIKPRKLSEFGEMFNYVKSMPEK